MGHQLLALKCQRDLAGSLHSDRGLEPQGGGLGCGGMRLAGELVSWACLKERISRRRERIEIIEVLHFGEADLEWNIFDIKHVRLTQQA